MHILFIAGWWPNKTSPLNGVFVQEHAMAIAEFTKITVVHFEPIEKPARPADLYKQVEEEIVVINKNLTVISYTVKLLTCRFGILDRVVAKTLSQLVKQNRETSPFTHVHLNILQTAISSSVIAFAKKNHLPLLLTEHHSFYHREIYFLKPEEVERKKKEVQHQLNDANLKVIMPVSKQLGDVLIRDYAAPENKIHVVPNIANDCFALSTVKETLDKETIDIFAAAIWAPPKNPVLFLQVLKQLKSQNNQLYNRLRLRWGGIGSQMEEVKAFIENELADLQITFLGLLDKQQIEAEMQQADFLVHPSDAENLPCIIIESICTGLPVLSVNINGVGELINPENGLLYKVKEQEDFYNRFMEMVSHIKHFKRVDIAAAARKKYSAAAVGKQIYELYKTANTN